ncbi:uncharacterized protein LOC121385569 [Gigantopelta aegis]|uniref:uncharacterized protein LOC121385569 n=1 Tax=Gigantopelta aegis TaxID=1735272 RepID=UPI001B88C220|nr:uncharacterized protein LOC121385569 [Gigantopelta aegis]
MAGRVALAVITFFAVISTANGQVDLFDCDSRPTQKCTDGATCNTTTKLCTGCQTKNGYACEANAPDAANATDCQAAPCENGGTCLQGGGCRCTPAYTGATCATETVLLTCAGNPPSDTDAMVLDVTKLVGANESQIIVEGANSSNTDDDRCFGSSGQPLNMTNIDTARATTTCPNAMKITLNGNAVYSRTFLVRFKHGMTSFTTDFKVKAECGPSGSKVTVTVPAFISDGDTPNLPVQDVGQTVAGANVTMTLSIGGSPLTQGNTYTLTDTIQVKIALNLNDSAFVAIRLESFTVDNGHTPLTTIDLIKNSCPTGDSKVVMKTMPSRLTDNEVVFDTAPVIIDPTVKNAYTAVVLVCRNQDKQKCDPVACDSGNPSGFGRRRKREEPADTATLNVQFSVDEKNSIKRAINDIKDNINNQEVCVLSSEMTATLVAMAIAILLLLAVVLVLIVRAIMSYRRQTTIYQHNPLQDSTSAVSLPKLVSTGY